MKKFNNLKLAKQIRKAILDDVTDRRGWRQEWDGFDADVQKDIKCAWDKLIADILSKVEES